MTLVPLNEIADGIAASPSLCFQNEPSTGFFRKAAGKMGISVLGAEVGELSGNGLAGGIHVKSVTFQAAGAHVWTGTIPIPAGALLLDVGAHGVTLWGTATSASLIVGDDDSANGFFTATDLLVAGDLLAGETNNIQHPGGKAGAYLASEQRDIYRAAARNVIGVITQVGASNAGTTILYAVYAVPVAIAPVQTA